MQSAVTSDSQAIDTPKQGLPVTIITGFLGSGKTTLLNHILSNQQGLKTAVLVNEFGEIGIDNELIVSTDEDMVELNNGCICCTINNDLVDAVYKVLERQEHQENIDYLVVETTGLADPLPVAMTFLSSELRDLTRLDSIVTVVDAANYSLDLFNSQAAHSQIAYGDVVLLNKVDLVNEGDLDLLEVKIRDVKEGARILRTTNSQVPLALILSVGLFESDQYFDQESSHAHEHHDHDHHDHHHHDHHDHDDHDHSQCEHDHDAHEHHHHHNHEHHHHHHDHSHHLENDGFTSISFESDQPLSIRKFQYFLDNQLPETIFRGKGIMWFEESPKRHIFHLCGKRFTMDDEEWKGKQKNQLVLIGQNLDHGKLYEQLENCICLPSVDSGK